MSLNSHLQFEQQVLQDLKCKETSLSVFGQGVPNVPKTVAMFLSTFTSLSQNHKDSFPDLIFLINFNEIEFACIEHWMTIFAELKEDKRQIISLTKIS